MISRMILIVLLLFASGCATTTNFTVKQVVPEHHLSWEVCHGVTRTW